MFALNFLVQKKIGFPYFCNFMREMFSIFSDRYHPLMKFENIDVITGNDKEIFEIFQLVMTCKISGDIWRL